MVQLDILLCDKLHASIASYCIDTTLGDKRWPHHRPHAYASTKTRCSEMRLFALALIWGVQSPTVAALIPRAPAFVLRRAAITISSVPEGLFVLG